MSLGGDWVHAIKKAVLSWDPSKHPRGRDGRFIEVGDMVAVFQGPGGPQIGTGRVVGGHLADDGRFFIAVESAVDDKTEWYRPKQIEQIKPKAVLRPVVPIADIGNVGTQAPWGADEVAEIQQKTADAMHTLESTGMADEQWTIGHMGKGASGPGAEAAAEIVKSQKGYTFLDYSDSPLHWQPQFEKYKVHNPGPAGAIPLKTPVELNGEEWLHAVNILDYVDGGADKAGFGFTSDGLSLVISDYVKFQADYAGWPNSLTEKVSAQYKVDYGITTVSVSPPIHVPEQPKPVAVPGGKTPADLIRAIRTSAVNKGLLPHQIDAVQAEVEAALVTVNPNIAHKHLAVAMTIAKLGGKQRARYKQLLDQHMGVSKPPVQKAPAGAAPPGAMSAVAPKGMKVVGLNEGKTWVQHHGAAGISKGAVQAAIAGRMGHIPAAEFARVLYDSPGHHGSDLHSILHKAWLSPGDYVGGNWRVANGSYGNRVLLHDPSSVLTQADLDSALRFNAVNAMIATWAATSNDTNVRSLIMQEAAQAEFGLDPSWIYAWPDKVNMMDEHRAAHMDTYRAFLRAMYDNTQAELAASGIKYVRLRRGVHHAPIKTGGAGSLVGKGSVGPILMRPMSSFSSSQSMAASPAFGSHSVLDTYVPAELIVGSARTGFGCYGESEWVVLGGPNEVTILTVTAHGAHQAGKGSVY